MTVSTMNTTQKKIALVADDYTGAGDSAIHFVKNGFPVELLVAESGCDFTAAVVAVNSETRFLEPADAARAVERIFQRCCRSGCAGFFKKTDSALRGNPGSETEAALNATGLRAALVCSAIPAMRRTCVGGVMYLNGLPLHLSEIGSDQFTPLASSDVAAFWLPRPDCRRRGLAWMSCGAATAMRAGRWKG